MTKRFHDTLDPRRRGWILNDAWLESLREDLTIFLYIHEKGSYLERFVYDRTHMRRTERILGINAAEFIEWCEDQGINVVSSPVAEFDSVKAIKFRDENQEFSFRMRWPSFA